MECDETWRQVLASLSSYTQTSHTNSSKSSSSSVRHRHRQHWKSTSKSGPWLAFSEGPGCLLRTALPDSRRSDAVLRGHPVSLVKENQDLPDRHAFVLWVGKLCGSNFKNSQQWLPLLYTLGTHSTLLLYVGTSFFSRQFQS